jgi:hypothetical protein
VTDLVRVGANGVLAIDQASARAQMRTDAGDWRPVVKLPFEEVTDVASRNSDVLSAGFSSGAVYAGLFDPQLSARGRWKLDNTSYADLGVAGLRQMTTESTRALLPNGALGPAKPLSDSTDPRKRMGRPTLLETSALAIVFLPKDERMSVEAPAGCERVTAPGQKALKASLLVAVTVAVRTLSISRCTLLVTNILNTRRKLFREQDLDCAEAGTGSQAEREGKAECLHHSRQIDGRNDQLEVGLRRFNIVLSHGSVALLLFCCC